MSRRIGLRIIVLLVAATLTLPWMPVQARLGQQQGHHSPRAVLVCDLRSGRIVEMPHWVIPHRPAFAEDLSRCGLSGGVLATFDIQGERFRIWATNPTSVEQIIALQAGTATAHIPNGVILYGPGQAGYNAPWSWHLDPEQIELTDFATEVCDGKPSFVEANVAYFVEAVGRYCPWTAVLVDVVDLR